MVVVVVAVVEVVVGTGLLVGAAVCVGPVPAGQAKTSGPCSWVNVWNAGYRVIETNQGLYMFLVHCKC